MKKRSRISSADTTNLRSALQFRKYQSATIVARLLLEAFIYRDGLITADWFCSQRACEKGRFTLLRERLIADEFLIFREDTRRYFAGPKLVPYLENVRACKVATLQDLESKANREDLDKKADKRDLAMVVNEVVVLKEQVARIMEMLAELKRLQAPPPSEMAQRRSKELAEELARVMVSFHQLQ